MIKLKQMLQHGDLLDRYGARLQVLGQTDLIKPDLRKAVDRAVEMTAKNDKAVLNVCFPYTSREEITTAIRGTVEEWSRPVAAPPVQSQRRSPFREEHIVSTIRAKEIESGFTSPALVSSPLSQPPLLDVPAPGPPQLSPSSSSTSLHSTADSATDPFSTPFSLSSTPTISSVSDLTSPPSPQIHALTSTSNSHQKPSLSHPSPEQITTSTLTAHTYAPNSPPLDLLIRTSGVERLSDFMLWQCHEQTQIVFLKTLWPAFDLWHFLPVIWEWQWRVRKGEERGRRELDGR